MSIPRPGWKKVLTQIERGVWARVRVKCYREGISQCDAMNRAMSEWAPEGGDRVDGVGVDVERKKGELF